MKSIIFSVLLFSISSFANELQSLSSLSEGGNFISSYRCKVLGNLNSAISCATGAGIRDAYSACRNFPCEICAIESIVTTGKAEGGDLAVATVESTIKGYNCK